MIEIKFADGETKLKICSRFSVKDAQNIKVYVAKENSNVLGYCGFKMDSDKGELLFSSVNDSSLKMIEDGLLRASLSYLHEFGVKTVSCGEITDNALLKRLGFKKSEEFYILDLTHSFLTCGCGCAK